MNQEQGFKLKGFYRVRDREVIASYETRYYDGKDLDEIMAKAFFDGLVGNPDVVLDDAIGGTYL